MVLQWGRKEGIAMISYMVIDRIEGKYAVCEVENISINDEVRISNPLDVDCFMVDIPLALFDQVGIEAKEQGEYLVNHDGNNVVEVFEF